MIADKVLFLVTCVCTFVTMIAQLQEGTCVYWQAHTCMWVPVTWCTIHKLMDRLGSGAWVFAIFHIVTIYLHLHTSLVLRWNIQQWAWPVTAGVLWFCSVRWCRDSEVLETCTEWINRRLNRLVVRMAASSNRQWCAVRSTCSNRFEEWEEWMLVSCATWFDESRDAVDQLELETGCWWLCKWLFLWQTDRGDHSSWLRRLVT